MQHINVIHAIKFLKETGKPILLGTRQPYKGLSESHMLIIIKSSWRSHNTKISSKGRMFKPKSRTDKSANMTQNWEVMKMEIEGRSAYPIEGGIVSLLLSPTRIPEIFERK